MRYWGGMPGSGYCTVDLKKNTGLERPVLEKQPDYVHGIPCRVVYRAQIAIGMRNYLMEAKDLSFEEAYILASAIVDVKISQLVDPLLTVRAEIDLSRLY